MPAIRVSESDFSAPLSGGQSAADLWLHCAAADNALCRELAERFGARLPRTLRSQRVGWTRQGQPGYGLLLPDYLPSATGDAGDGDWYIYYVAGQTLFRRGRTERERLGMLVLAECADDWAELLRRALRDQAADVQYQVTPEFRDALGETQHAATGYRFEMETCAPPGAVRRDCFSLVGTGQTPEAAARGACRAWLDREEG